MPLVINRIRQYLLSLGTLLIFGAILTLLLFPQTPVLAGAADIIFEQSRLEGYPVGFEHSKECVIKAGGWKFEGGLGIPNLPGAPDPTEGPTQFIIWLFVFALGAVGALSFLMLVWAGVQYMAAVGNPTAQGAAKERMTSVILGILLLLASYVILYTINPNLVDLKEPTLPTMPKEGVDLITKAADRDCGLGDGGALPLPPDIEHHGIGDTCSDGIDNDSDGDIDGADQGCFGTEFACADGTDNDADGFTDGADPDCRP